jgi:uncharacterized protein
LCRAADLILHCGDFTTGSFLDELRELGPPVEGVYGNMDEPAIRAALPLERVVEIERARIGMVHIPGPTTGRAPRLRARFAGSDAVVYGHTHVPELAREDGLWILNPGSPTERRRAPTRAMLMLDVDAGVIEPSLIELT